MLETSWEYDRASGKSNGSSGVLASISESWSRCRDFGLRAAGTPQEIVLSEDKFKVVLEKNESIRNFVLPELELLYNQIAGTNFMVAYADGGGIVLDSIQDHDFKAGEGGKAVIPGSVWIENHRGTNALGLAIHTRRPSIVTGKDHFFHKLDDLSCFAVPIFDHEETLLGVIDATSNAKARNDHTLALVKLASKNIENRLFTERFCDSIILTFHARQEYLPTTSAAMLAVDEYGFIEGANANAKSVLSGLDVSRQQHFGEIFDVQFFDVIDKLRSNEIISIKDRLGAVVFMRAQHSVSKKVINLEGDLLISNGKAQPLSNEKPSSNLLIAEEATKAATVFDDELLTKEMLENFDVQGNEVTGMFDNKSKSYVNPVTLDTVLSSDFKEGTKKNPFSNLLLTEINDEPNRNAAPPAFNVDVDEDITKSVKKSVQMMNPGIKNTNKQLFGDLWEQFQLSRC